MVANRDNQMVNFQCCEKKRKEGFKFDVGIDNEGVAKAMLHQNLHEQVREESIINRFKLFDNAETSEMIQNN